MIEYIRGELTELTPALATVEAGGVGYGLNISLNTYSHIQGKKEVKLYVYEAIREDAYVLYGFGSKKEFAVTVNLAPADIKKEGPMYDLPIAIGLLRATKRLPTEELHRYALAGELALSGEVRRVRGIVPIVMRMRDMGLKAAIVPFDNAGDASIVGGIDVIPVRTLREAAEYLAGACHIEPARSDFAELVAGGNRYDDDFADVRG